MDQQRLSEPGFQLVWPRTLFAREATRLLNDRDSLPRGWDSCTELLLEHAFLKGFGDGPLTEFQGIVGRHSFAGLQSGKPLPLTARQEYLRDLVRNQDHLHEDSPPRRAYYVERVNPEAVAASKLNTFQVADEFARLVSELDGTGYFDKRFGSRCAKGGPRDPGPHRVILRELRHELDWPLDADELTLEPEYFFSLIELLHDNIARPRALESTHMVSGEQCRHYVAFESGLGQAIYRWRVNKILDRSDLGLRLAEEGEDRGRLVTLNDEGRTELLHSLIERKDSNEEADEVLAAVASYRARGASREQKQHALAGLCRVLEQRRHTVIQDQIAKKDSGALFDIANNFHIRHGDGARPQRKDYEDYYLDWLFWLYLSTVELTNRVLDDQATRLSTSR